jgi:hypothetical protein
MTMQRNASKLPNTNFIALAPTPQFYPYELLCYTNLIRRMNGGWTEDAIPNTYAKTDFKAWAYVQLIMMLDLSWTNWNQAKSGLQTAFAEAELMKYWTQYCVTDNLQQIRITENVTQQSCLPLL